MKFTIWEKAVLHDILGLTQSENIADIETLLELRKKLKLSDEQLKQVKSKVASVYEDIEDCKLNRREIAYILKKMQAKHVAMPSSEKEGPKSLELHDKIKDQHKNGEEV